MRFWTQCISWALLSCSITLATANNSFTLTDGGWTYSEDIDRLGEGGFVDPSGTNHMSQNWWWFHTKDQPNELPLSNLQSLTQSAPNQVSLYFVENSPSTAGSPSTFGFHLDYTLNAISSISAKVTIQWTVTVLSGYPEEFGFLPYFNFDLNNTPFDDTAQFLSPNQIQVGDSSATAIITGSAPGQFVFRWQIDSAPSLFLILMDSNFDHLNNGGSPFGPGDFEGAFEHSAMLSGLGATFSGTLEKLVIVPEPASLWMVGVGLVGCIRCKMRHRVRRR